MRNLFQLVILLLLMSLFSSCSLSEEEQDATIHLVSDLKDASIYIDKEKIGNFEKGRFTTSLEEGEYDITIESISSDFRTIYKGELTVYLGSSSESTFKIPYIKKASQIALADQDEAKKERERRHRRNVYKAAAIMYKSKDKKLQWQNERYSKEELKAYKDNKTFKKVGSYNYAQKFCRSLCKHPQKLDNLKRNNPDKITQELICEKVSTQINRL